MFAAQTGTFGLKNERENNEAYIKNHNDSPLYCRHVGRVLFILQDRLFKGTSARTTNANGSVAKATESDGFSVGVQRTENSRRDSLYFKESEKRFNREKITRDKHVEKLII